MMDRLGRKPKLADYDLPWWWRKQQVADSPAKAKYDGQSWQEAKIGGVCFIPVVEEARDQRQSWPKPNMIDSLANRKPELADYVLPWGLGAKACL